MNHTIKPQQDCQSTIKQKLTLMQLSDSFFPSGSYTQSHGLESLVQSNQVQQPEDFISFVQILLRNKIGTCDLVALIHSHKGISLKNLAQVRQADKQLFAQTAIAISRQTQRQSGRALLMVAQSTWQNKQLETLAKDRIANNFNCLHPVVFGAVGSIAGLDLTDTSLAFLHGFITGLLGAGIRLGILGHLQAQQISLELSADIETVLSTALSMDLERMYSCTPAIDLAQMRHGRLNSRLFAS